MQINPVALLSVESLRPNPENPKQPLGLAYKRGLRASLERFGFSGVFQVASNLDGTYTVLDGTSRLDELERAGVESIPCVPIPECAEGFPGWEDARREFVLSYDRNRKQFDESAVLAQLEKLAERGRNLKELAALTAKPNLDRLLSERAMGSIQKAGDATNGKPAANASLVLYGPADDVKGIKELLKQTKGALTNLGKAHKALAQASAFLDWSDEKLLAVLLATVARFGVEQG